MPGAKKVITKTALRRLMKDECDAGIVAGPALAYFMDYLQDLAVETTKKALKITKHAKRKTITKADIKLAIK